MLKFHFLFVLQFYFYFDYKLVFGRPFLESTIAQIDKIQPTRKNQYFVVKNAKITNPLWKWPKVYEVVFCIQIYKTMDLWPCNHICRRNHLVQMVVKLLRHCLKYFIRHKINYKIISNTLVNFEYSPNYGQKRPKNAILIKSTVFWPYLGE